MTTDAKYPNGIKAEMDAHNMRVAKSLFDPFFEQFEITFKKGQTPIYDVDEHEKILRSKLKAQRNEEQDAEDADKNEIADWYSSKLKEVAEAADKLRDDLKARQITQRQLALKTLTDRPIEEQSKYTLFNHWIKGKEDIHGRYIKTIAEQLETTTDKILLHHIAG